MAVSGTSGGSQKAATTTSSSNTPTVCTSPEGKTIPCSLPDGSYYYASAGCYAISLGEVTPGKLTMACTQGAGGMMIGNMFTIDAAQAPPPPPDPAVLAQQAVAQMNLRAIKAGMAPPPGAGKHGVIGLPTWMWVADPGPQTTGPQTRSVTVRGYTVTANATMGSVTWDMGDGTTVTCGKGTPYTSSYGAQPSPDCGHVYQQSGYYTVAATTRWTVNWSGIGQTGTIPMSFTTTSQVTEVELQAIGQK